MESRTIGDPNVFAVVYTPAFVNEARTWLTGSCHLMINGIVLGSEGEDIYYLNGLTGHFSHMGSGNWPDNQMPMQFDSLEDFDNFTKKNSTGMSFLNSYCEWDYFNVRCFRKGYNLTFYWYLFPNINLFYNPKFAYYPQGLHKAVVPIATVKAVADEFERQIAEVLLTQVNSEEAKRKYICGYGEPANDE